MSRAKPSTIKNARAVKALGLVNYDLRKPLTESQKRNVNRLAKKFSDVIKNKSSYFHLKAETSGIAKKARDSHVQTHGKDLFIPKRGYSHAKIIDDRVIITKKDKAGYQKRETLLLTRKADIFEKLEALSNEKLPPGHYAMVRIGDNSPFGQSLDFKALMNYVTNWQTDSLKDYHRGKYTGSKTHDDLIRERDGLITQMYIVSFDLKRSHRGGLKSKAGRYAY